MDANNGTVIGIVTQRRFPFAEDLRSLAGTAENLRRHFQVVGSTMSVEIMGIDFGSFSQMMAEALMLLRRTLEANANTGIGVGFSSASYQRSAGS